MAIAVTTTKNSVADSYAALSTYASLHTANPGTTGASELTGTGYARQAITWGAASNGVKTATVTFSVPAGSTIVGLGLWSAATGGTFRDGVTVTSQTFAQAGSYAVTLTFTQS